jgi:GNAT superfamily N-acetyltransferase
MISLWQQDHEERSDLSPWLASLFVHPFHRKKGIASLLITALEKEAIRLGINKVYLVTEESKGLYEKHGWLEMAIAQTDHGTASLMFKEL